MDLVMVILAAGVIADVVTTALVLKAGGTELNPFARWLMARKVWYPYNAAMIVIGGAALYGFDSWPVALVIFFAGSFRWVLALHNYHLWNGLRKSSGKQS